MPHTTREIAVSGTDALHGFIHSPKSIYRSAKTSRTTGILRHLLEAKFSKSQQLSHLSTLQSTMMQSLVKHLVQQKFEQRVSSGDELDHMVGFLAAAMARRWEMHRHLDQQALALMTGEAVEGAQGHWMNLILSHPLPVHQVAALADRRVTRGRVVGALCLRCT